MKVLCIMGTQRRHKFFLRQIVQNFEVVGIILYKRNLVQPTQIPAFLLSKEELELEKRHLALLKRKEEEYFSQDPFSLNKNRHNIKEVDSKEELNGRDIAKWITRCKPDVVVNYGSGILGKRLLEIMPKWKINLHGGLSPYYKGSATLMWPFYFQQPQLVGITYHLISSKIDGGAILQHYRPAMFEGDTVVDICCRAIRDGAAIGAMLLNKLASMGQLKMYPQKTNGKLFLEKDYRPFHIKVVYDLIKNGLIEDYLKNKKAYDSQYTFVDQLGIEV